MQIQRLFEIVYVLLQKKRITAKELAERFEVSTRTIYRDLDALSAAGIPLYTNKGSGGGIFLMEDFTLQKSIFTEEEQGKLLEAMQCYRMIDQTNMKPLLTKISSIFQKEQTDWIDVDFSDWNDQAYGKEVFQKLKGAILDKRILSFRYHSGDGLTTKRKVEPLQLLFKGQAWYLLAYCTTRKAQRYFKLRRMKDIEQSNEMCQHMLEEKKEESPNTYPSIEKMQLVLQIHERQAYRIYDEYDMEQITKQDDHFIVTIQFPKGEWLYGYLMSFGSDLTVISPINVKEEIKIRYQKALQHYTENVQLNDTTHNKKYNL